MKITLESTERIVTVQKHAGGDIPARVWQGQTEDGIPVEALIPVIYPTVRESDPDIEEKTAQFEQQLKRIDCAASMGAIPLRFIL